MTSELAKSAKSPLVKEASNIVQSGDRSKKAMDRMKQIENQIFDSDQVTSQDRRIFGCIFEAFLVDGGISAELQRMAKS